MPSDESTHGADQVAVAKCSDCGYIYGDDLDYRFPNPSECQICGEETEKTTVAESKTVRSLVKNGIRADGGTVEDGADQQVLAETQVAGFGLANGKVLERLLLEFDEETPAAKVIHERIDYAEPLRNRDPHLDTLGEIVANPHDSHRTGEQKLEIGTGHGEDRIVVDYHEHASRVYVRHEHFDGGEWTETGAWELHPATGVEEVATDGGRPVDSTERTRVGHCKADETDVYAGRGKARRDILDMNPGARGWLGNPFTTEDYTREESIRRFREVFEWRLEADPEFREAVRDLSGKTLGCWCQRLDEDGPDCHAEIIAEWADRLAREVEPDTDQQEDSR